MSNRTKVKKATRAVAQARQAAERRRRTGWISTIAAVVLVLAGGVGYAVYRAQQPSGTFPVPAGVTADRTGVRVGNGPVTVELYLDYLCPACRQFEADAKDDLARLLEQQRITLIVHPVAILDRYSTNRYSTRAAAAAGCAADSGKLLEYSEVLYDRQPAEGGPGHTNNQLVDIGASVGLGDAFGQCVRDNRYSDWVSFVTASMAERQVTGTPTVFVNGVRLRPTTAAALTAAVNNNLTSG